MLARLTQLILSIGVVGIAFVAGIVAAGVINPSPFFPSPSAGPSARFSGPASTRLTSAMPSPDESLTAVLVGAGDIAECARFEDELTADLIETIPGIVFTLGDNANPDGTLTEFEECYGPTWGRPGIKERTRPTIGDNEYNTSGAVGYFTYFGDAAGEPGTGYYTYDAGAWRIYVLNSECRQVGGCGEGSPQESWLLDDLAAEPRRCVLAMWHHPYFTSGRSFGGSSSTRNLWRILQAAGAELVLSGSDHHYERFEPQTGAGDADPDGIVQFVVGTGGSEGDDLRVDAPHSVARAFDVFGVLRLELGPRGYAFEFISVAGPEFSDSGTGKCN